MPVQITAKDVPEAKYTFSVNDMTIKANNESIDAISYFWDFGDGTTSTEENPSHTFLQTASFNIQLIAINGCGADTVIRNLIITNVDELGESFVLNLYPNPNKGQFDIQVKNNLAEDMELMIWDVLGQQVFDQKWLNMKDLKKKISVSDLPKGNYHYAFHVGAKRKTGILTIE